MFFENYCTKRSISKMVLQDASRYLCAYSNLLCKDTSYQLIAVIQSVQAYHSEVPDTRWCRVMSAFDGSLHPHVKYIPFSHDRDHVIAAKNRGDTSTRAKSSKKVLPIL
jgi:hypothetical protein